MLTEALWGALHTHPVAVRPPKRLDEASIHFTGKETKTVGDQVACPRSKETVRTGCEL